MKLQLVLLNYSFLLSDAMQSAVLPQQVVCLFVCDVDELWSYKFNYSENNYMHS